MRFGSLDVPRPFPIDFFNYLSGRVPLKGIRNAYGFKNASIAAALALSIVAFAFPQVASASWFSSLFAPAAQAESSIGPHDASVQYLESANNIDPNPTKGEIALSVTDGTALIPQQGPEGTPDTDATPKNGSISTYLVRTGDTLSEIADMFGVSQNTILWSNNLASAKDIHPGETLVILPVTGIEHTVKKGETLASLAKSYGGDAADIASFNGLDSSAALVAGSSVIIPGGELAAAAPAKTSSTAKSGVKQGGSLKNVQANPYRGGSGAALTGFYGNPLPGGILTQSIHGWNAVDIGAHTGTPIYAAAAGTVIVSRADAAWNGGYGSYVVIDHGNGTQTLYAHMSKVAASVGASVAKGALIGYVGMTGEATGPHLHFEVRGARNPFASCAVGRSCSPQ